MPTVVRMAVVAMLAFQTHRRPLTDDTAACAGRHVRFEVLRGERTFKCLLTDMGSRNGTWLNRARLQRCDCCHHIMFLAHTLSWCRGAVLQTQSVNIACSAAIAHWVS